MKEFKEALSLASDEDLRELTDILFRRQFNPVDYVSTPEPDQIQSYDRRVQIRLLEERFCFLAADGVTVLRGEANQLEYRQVLLQICRYLKVPHAQEFATLELEAEIYLALLRKGVERLPAKVYRQLTGQLRSSLSKSNHYLNLPPTLQRDPLRLVMKGGSALAVNAFVRPWLLRQIAHGVALQIAKYEALRQVARQGGGLMLKLQNRLAMQVASRRAAASLVSYGAVRGALAFLGPALWIWFFSDLGWRAIATNYGRVIPAVFTLAQIRLTHADYLEAEAA